MRTRIVAVTVVVLGLLLTAAAEWLLFNADRRTDELRLGRAADVAARAVEEQLRTNIALLRSVDAMIVSSGLPRTREFATYAETLEMAAAYPGVQGIGFALDLFSGDPANAQEVINGNGFEVALKPRENRDRYTSIVLLMPDDERNLAAMGYDMMTEARRGEAMTRAADVDGPAMSRAVTLLQEIDEDVQPGFLLYLPTYLSDGSLLGWTYSPLRAHDFFGAALDPLPDPDIALRIADAETELFRTAGFVAEDGPREIRRIDAAGVTWTMTVMPLETFANRADEIGGWSVLAFGLALTIGAAWFVVQRERAAGQLQTALARAEDARATKEVLLSEVNHRVANSLNLVSALLSLQERTTTDESARHALKAASSRISAVARVHRDLYVSHESQTMSAETFFGSLAEGLREQLPADSKVSIETRIAAGTLKAETAISLGVAISELFTNALKYAVPAGADRIVICWQALPDGRREMAVWDNGPGPNGEVSGTGLGSRIVEAMSRQLKADLHHEVEDDGYRVRFLLPPVPADA